VKWRFSAPAAAGKEVRREAFYSFLIEIIFLPVYMTVMVIL
jgi:hypothetical protein